MSNRFDGFPEGTIRFLADLQDNNNRDWFNANKDRYETEWLEPSLAFIAAMKGPLEKLSPCFTAIPKRTGGSLMRIYRDTRFSKDGAPYKTNIGIQFRHQMGKDIHAPGFYFHVSPGEVFFGAGIWHPDNRTLNLVRDRIVDETAQWKRIVRGRPFVNEFEFHGDSLKRPPHGYDPDHEFVHDLKRKDLIVLKQVDPDLICKPAIVRDFTGFVRKSLGLVTFICDALKLPS